MKESLPTTPQNEITPRKEVFGLQGKFAEMAKYVQRIWNLEAWLKKDQAEESGRLRAFADYIVTTLEKKGRRAIEITALITALGLAGCREAPQTADTETAQSKAKTEFKLENYPSTGTESPELKSSGKLTETEREQLLRETGVDFNTLAEKADFDAQLQVPTKTGRYIVHIGQWHHVKDIEKDIKFSKEIVEIQKKIETVVLVLANKGTTNIFVEGYTVETAEEFPGDYLEIFRKEANEVKADERCFDKLLDIYNNYEKNVEFDGTFSTDRVVSQKRNIYRNRALALYEQLSIQGEIDPKVQSAYEKCLQRFKPHGSLEAFGDDGIYLPGATDKLESEGIIKSLPAEKDISCDASAKCKAELEPIRAKYFHPDFSKNSLSDMRRLAERYDEAKKKVDKAIMDDREDVAVEIIKEQSKKKDHKFFVLVYGSAHDFKNNVNGTELGLIRLSPKEQAKPETSTAVPTKKPL